VFEDAQKVGGKFSESIFEDGLCLPSGSNLTDHDLERVIEIVGLQAAS
jgi:dTDP-4-amino-4,6-dideoxygalactose transaminase